MATGFVTERPVIEEFGGALSSNNRMYAQRFLCPGTGVVEITELGFYGDCAGLSSDNVNMAIYTDADGVPGSVIDEAVCEIEVAYPTPDPAVHYWNDFGFYGPPILTCGQYYWIVVYVYDTTNVYYFPAGSGDSYVLYVDPGDPGLVSPWDGGSIETYDMGLYAVYQTTGGGEGLLLSGIMGHKTIPDF